MRKTEPVAIVGVGGVFPGASNLGQFWDIIESGTDTSSVVPEGRWALAPEDVVDKSGIQPDKVYTDRGCFIRDVDLNLDGLEISKEFVDSLDPVNHLLLYAGRQAWLDTKSNDSIDRKRTGIIIGNIALPTNGASSLCEELFTAEYEEQIFGTPRRGSRKTTAPINRYVTGLPAGILARALGLGFGSYTLDAACASSLYAVKLAVDELTSGRADVMLSGGLSRPDCLYTQMGFSQLHALSKTGKCSPFDSDGDGLLVGEGSGIVVLKRLSDALRDGDQIYATIKGIGLSNDLDGSLLAPASEGQVRAMRTAYENAGWNPSDVDLVECHATGTPVGDAVEFNSLRELWSESEWKTGQCALGAAKSNVGHLLTGAGAAGLIRTLLAMKHETLPPVANFSKAGVDLDGSPFTVLQKAKEWKRRSESTPRRAGVSAFGFGGINAHVLVEEWTGSKKKASKAKKPKTAKSCKVAIVAMDTAVGHWDNLESFRERVFGQIEDQPESNLNWWLVQQSKWFENSPLGKNDFKGYYLNDLEIPINRFRIPPKEMEETLPQQALMLKVAARAFEDLQTDRAAAHRSGVFVGVGLDLCTTHFHFRWTLLNKARRWNQELDLNLSEDELNDWIDGLRESAGPALNANRTMGALGGIVASRLAREFRIGGPSHTVQNEEASGIRALEAGTRALQNGDLDQVLVGAVDLSGEIRSVLGTHGIRPFAKNGESVPFAKDSSGAIPGEGAVALILKRADDAIKDGDRIYAIIDGIGSAIGGESDSVYPREQPYVDALVRAYDEANISPDAVSYVETHGSGNPEEDQVEARALTKFFGDAAGDRPIGVSSCMGFIGHTGAASGLASIVKACLSLHHEIIPGVPGHKRGDSHFGSSNTLAASATAQYWLRDRKSDQRRAGVSSFSVDGNCTHVVLSAPAEQISAVAKTEKQQPLGPTPAALFMVTGDSPGFLQTQLDSLASCADGFRGRDLADLAREWHNSQIQTTGDGKQLAIVSESIPQLATQVELAHARIETMWAARDTKLESELEQSGIFFNPHSLLPDYGIAYVYPGSGNHYPNMGRELAMRFPNVLRRLDGENEHLASQMVPDAFWSEKSIKAISEDHHAMIFGQVALGTMITDIVQQSGLRPNAVIGYSLGESAGLFSTRAWRDRDEMYRRMKAGTLFTTDLAGPCKAARQVWGIPDSEPINWKLGVIACSSEKVSELLSKYSRVYLLIINTPEECVIGGDAKAVDEVVKRLKCQWYPIEGVTTVHCDVATPVEKEYHDLHLFPTNAPDGVRYYSGASGTSYDVNRESAAASILAQALEGVNYPKVINSAYNDGIRTFIEMGPGATCSRMIPKILGERPHLAMSACYPCQNETIAFLRFLAKLGGNQFPLNLDFLHPGEAAPAAIEENVPTVTVALGGTFFSVPRPERDETDVALFDPEPDYLAPEPVKPTPPTEFTPAPAPEPAAPPISQPSTITSQPLLVTATGDPFIDQMNRTLQARTAAHDQFLKFSANLQTAMAQTVTNQMSLLGQLPEGTTVPTFSPPTTNTPPPPNSDLPTPISRRPAPLNPAKAQIDRAGCMAIAIGKIGDVLGEAFAEVDNHPTRVRLPDEPLMLCDRIMSITAEPGSMTSGSLVTEHDIFADAWYLDCGKIPTCIAVEAGQADLFLSGYLGIDFQTKGNAVYRLLDAEITFHDTLPGPGSVINYDIHIDHFFRQGDTWLFRFSFDGTVNGKPLLTMRKGCAGFFTQGELDAGKGIVHTKLDLQPVPGNLPADWSDIVPLTDESISDARLDTLRTGDLAGCFGNQFANLPIANPLTLPSGRMKLVDRVLAIEPQGGRYGLGKIRAEADIHPDDWFLTCHFSDDMVMPGTLMYECCLHTLRILLLRMGWVGEADNLTHGPIPGFAGKLKCRGQVIASTSKVVYEISIKELGYNPAPYAIADALMYADGRPIVEMQGMSIQFEGWTKESIEQIWSAKGITALAPALPLSPSPNLPIATAKPLFDDHQILAYAIGKPSDAFGDRYQIFDTDRKIARLPGPPYKFLNRIVSIENCEPWVLKAGGKIVAEYDVPPDEWYFKENRQGDMPFAVLLEIALQPCGWLAGYLGSALTSDIDLSFRNLGGTAKQYLPVYADIGTLQIKVDITRVSSSGGMIIQNFDYEVHSEKGLIYKGDTYFGFFSKASLADQVGIRDANLYPPTKEELKTAQSFDYPTDSPFADQMMRMIDKVETYLPNGGPNGLGFIKGTKVVDPEEWFFKAHFYQDPVCPGSLGLESYLQLMKVVLADKFDIKDGERLEAIAVGEDHEWVYRGQIIPTDALVTVEAVITEIDEEKRMVKADGYLSVDGRHIYGMKNFTAAVRQA
jgi:acyl transferase domain-containing protein/3-hydroxymyristoyl/3-hydroxydecanoyl-(acyl carrier protein) dehydratase